MYAKFEARGLTSGDGFYISQDRRDGDGWFLVRDTMPEVKELIKAQAKNPRLFEALPKPVWVRALREFKMYNTPEDYLKHYKPKNKWGTG
jgi:hypothetical protein